MGSVLWLASPAWAQRSSPPAGSEAGQVDVAIQQARATLDAFLRTAQNPPAGASDFRVKVRFSNARGSEHMWVGPFRQRDGELEGTLTNTPQIVTNLRHGQTVRFKKQDISDWGYVKDGKQVGSFTVCALLKTMPAAEAKRYREEYGFVCAD